MGPGAGPGTGTSGRDRGDGSGSSLGAGGAGPGAAAGIGSLPRPTWTGAGEAGPRRGGGRRPPQWDPVGGRGRQWAPGTGTGAGGGSAGGAALSGAAPQVKLTQEVRVHLLEQLSGLQGKQQRDAELLEDIR